MGTLKTYIIGFAVSVVLTVIAFLMVDKHVLSDHAVPSHEIAIALLVGLAVIQLIVQLICFLHVGREAKPRWNLIVFSFAVLIVTIVVGGSLWIMNHLMHEQMSADDILKDESYAPPAQ